MPPSRIGTSHGRLCEVDWCVSPTDIVCWGRRVTLAPTQKVPTSSKFKQTKEIKQIKVVVQKSFIDVVTGAYAFYSGVDQCCTPGV